MLASTHKGNNDAASTNTRDRLTIWHTWRLPPCSARTSSTFYANTDFYRGILFLLCSYTHTRMDIVFFSFFLKIASNVFHFSCPPDPLSRSHRVIYVVRTVDITADPSDRAVLTRGSATARLLELRLRIRPGTWMSVSCECCVLYVVVTASG